MLLEFAKLVNHLVLLVVVQLEIVYLVDLERIYFLKGSVMIPVQVATLQI
jgi:hypothetical protein